MSKKYPKIVGDSDESIDIDVKRFYMEGVEIHDECPECKTVAIRDLGQQYLSFPSTNSTMSEGMYCEPCGHEWDVDVVLKMSLEIAKGR